MEKLVRKTIIKYEMLNKGDHVVVGLSGGADSVCLIHTLHSMREEFSLKITATHINHMLREESYVDEAFSRDLCKELNIPFYSKTFDIVEIAKSFKISHETAGRDARYSFYDEILERVGATKIALAHHKNDRVETALLNLIRGTGLKGLASIPPIRDNIIRPLIEVSKQEILTYLQDKGLFYVEDYTNSESVYARNKVRNILIPLVECEFNKSFVNTLSNNIEVFAEENDFMEQEAERLFLKRFDGEGLSLLGIEGLHPAIVKRMLRAFLRRYYDNLTHVEKIHVDNIFRLIYMQSGQKTNLPNHMIAIKTYDKLLVMQESEAVSFYAYPLKLDETIYIPETNHKFHASFSKNFYEKFDNKFYTIHIDYDKIKHNLTIRQKQQHDSIYLKGIGNKSVSKFLKDMKVSSLKRDRLPFLFDGQECVMVGELRVNGHYYVDENTERVLYVAFWEDGNET